MNRPWSGPPQQRRASGLRGPLPWLGALLVAYLTVPVAAFLVHSAGDPDAGFGAPGLWGALGTSVESATISTAVLAFLGVPLAYLLAHQKGRLAGAAGALVQLPLALPPLMSGVVLLYVFGPGTWLGRLSGGRFTESLLGIVLAQSFVSAPFLVISARSAFRGVSRNFVDIAATAGLGPFARFTAVAVPLAGSGIRAGLLLAWLRAFGEYGATVMLSYHPYSMPVFTYVRFSAVGLPASQAPTLLALTVAGGLILLSRLPLGRAQVGRILSQLSTGTARPPRSGLGWPAAAVPPASALANGPMKVSFQLSSSAGDFSLDLSYRASSHRLAVLGPSGAGKSLTLRSLAGLAPGSVMFGNNDVSQLPPEQRMVGYVPQGDSLLPDRSAWANVMLGPRADQDVAGWWCAWLGVADLAERRPDQMSGGQRQRASLARALSCHPSVLLLDEPFTGLDAPVRSELVRLLRQLQLTIGISTVLVTHDVTEAALLADEVLVISGGRLLQSGPVGEVLRRPASPEVARLVGLANILPGTATSATSLLATGGALLNTSPHGVAAGRPLHWCVRPRDICVSAQPAEHAHLATLLDATDMGDRWVLRLALHGPGCAGSPPQQLEADAPDLPAGLRPGSTCWAGLAPDAVLVWPQRALDDEAGEAACLPGSSPLDDELAGLVGARA